MKILRETATGAYVVQAQGDMTEDGIQNRMQEMSGDPSIEYFVKDQLLEIMATPSDPRYVEQWHYYEADGGLNLPDAWDDSTGEGVIVAVIDTGITNHSDLRANILPGYDMIRATIAGSGLVFCLLHDSTYSSVM